MPSKQRSAAPSRADLLAEAAAVWASIAPTPVIVWVEDVYQTPDTWATAKHITRRSASYDLEKACKAGVLNKGTYRLAQGEKPVNVYWPAGLPEPETVK